MTDPETIREQVREAFRDTRYPGDDRLRGSDQGSEPYLLEEEFRGRDDWRALDAGFLDRAPDGFGSALHFFSDEAFRFYLPAYLIADLDDLLESADPAFSLCSRWLPPELFDPAQRRAIIAYLEHRAGRDAFDAPMIRLALRERWLPAVAGRGQGSADVDSPDTRDHGSVGE